MNQLRFGWDTQPTTSMTSLGAIQSPFTSEVFKWCRQMRRLAVAAPLHRSA